MPGASHVCRCSWIQRASSGGAGRPYRTGGSWELTVEKAPYRAAAREVTLADGEVLDGMELWLEAAEEISFAVLTAAGAVPARVLAAVVGAGGRLAAGGTFSTTSDGPVRISGAPPGPSELRRQRTGAPPAPRTTPSNRESSAACCAGTDPVPGSWKYPSGWSRRRRVFLGILPAGWALYREYRGACSGSARLDLHRPERNQPAAPS